MDASILGTNMGYAFIASWEDVALGEGGCPMPKVTLLSFRRISSSYIYTCTGSCVFLAPFKYPQTKKDNSKIVDRFSICSTICPIS